MPGGPTPIGAIAYTGIKFAGYTLAAHALRRSYGASRTGFLGVGAVRTAVGIGVGIPYAFFMLFLGTSFQSELNWWWFYVGLIPVRMLEWIFVIWVFYESSPPRTGRLLKYSAMGSAWSFVLDIPAMAALFTIPGGFWIC